MSKRVSLKFTMVITAIFVLVLSGLVSACGGTPSATRMAFIDYSCNSSSVDVNQPVLLFISMWELTLETDENGEPIYIRSTDNITPGFSWAYQWVGEGETGFPVSAGEVNWNLSSTPNEKGAYFSANTTLQWDRAGEVIVRLQQPESLVPPILFTVWYEGGDPCTITIVDPPDPPDPPDNGDNIQVTTDNADLITVDSAMLHGSVGDLGSVSQVEVFIEVGENSGGPYNNQTELQNMDKSGSYTSTISGLEPGKTYCYRTRVKIPGIGVVYGEEKCFTTASPDSPDIPIGTKNYYMALSPDKSTLYVGDYGPVLDGELGHVWVIDTANNEVIGEIEGLGDGFPYQIVFTPDGTKAYLAVTKKAGSTLTDGANRIVVIDTSSHQVVGSINIEGAQDYGPVTVAMHPDGDHVYTTHHGLKRIDAIDTTSDTVVSSVPGVGSVPMGIAITPDKTRLWVVNSVGNTLSVINIESSQMQIIQASIPHGLDPSGGHAFITITPDGKRAYVTNQGDSRIAVVNIDPSSGDDYLRVEYVNTTADVLNQVAISPDGKRALVGNTTDSVLIIDIDPTSDSYNKQIGSIYMGYSTVGVVYAGLPDALAYVAGAENVGVIKELP